MHGAKTDTTPALPGVRSAVEIDRHIGKQIRSKRRQLRFSQTELALFLGLSFQQVQKYERGANRISASKLYETARFLQVPLSYFFEALDVGNSGADGRMTDMARFVALPDHGDIARDFSRIESSAVRRYLVELVKNIVENGPGT